MIAWGSGIIQAEDVEIAIPEVSSTNTPKPDEAVPLPGETAMRFLGRDVVQPWIAPLFQLLPVPAVENIARTAF
ncbi:MAG: hypothetical protein GY822_06635 [Deltaproteobacteria bacterium]|nr:hypothetical protein [Deltaproteobacteria bacterium]